MDNPYSHGGVSLRQLAHFVAIAEHGTIGGAASALFMSHSAVSSSLNELERILGTDLCIRRRAQGITLTPAGRQVLERSRRLLADAAELEYIVQGRGGELSGPLGIGCFVTLAPTVLPHILTEYEALHPKVDVDFMEASQDKLQHHLLSGEIDMAVMYDMGDLQDFETVLLYKPRGYALLGEGHRLADKATLSLQELAEEPLVLFNQPPSTDYAMSAFLAQGLMPKIRHRTHSYELTRSLVARGSTYAILVQRPSNKASYEGLPIVEKEVEPPLPVCPVVLAWPRRSRPSPRAQAMMALAQRLYQGGASGGGGTLTGKS